MGGCCCWYALGILPGRFANAVEKTRRSNIPKNEEKGTSMAAEAGDSYTILIVDDDPDLLQLLSDGLELLGHFRVVRAANGIAGLEEFFAVRPDCMIIDIKMPG